ncbi:MAG: TonB-dependent receptor [Deltaproteobacteria bacterium]|jgi:outer membrane receptor protein involved in Fe transport|nr:TonB-dependent receptor [Deltaproteobacteria bacterium]
MRFFFSLALAAVLTLCPPDQVGRAWGQSRDDGLPAVVVSEFFNNPPMTVEEKAETTQVDVFGPVDLQNTDAAVLSDFLAEKGVGVFKAPNDSGHALTMLRGFRTDHLSKETDGRLLFLINGHRTGTGNAAQIPLVNVQRVEILRGPEMLRYSAASPGGIINVVTKRGGPQKLASSLEVGLGSYDLYKTELRLNGLSGGFDYSFGYSYSEKSDYDDAEGYLVPYTGVAAVHASAADFGYTFNDRHRFGWSTYLYKVDDAERPAYVDPTNIIASVSADNTFADRHNISNTFSYSGSTEDERLSWEAAYTFGQNENIVYSASSLLNYPMASKFDRQALQTSLTYSGDIFTLTGGFDYLHYETYEGAAGPFGTTGRAMVHTGDFKNLAGFLIGNVRLFRDRLIISGGLRYDSYRVDDENPSAEDYNPPRNPLVYGHDRWETSRSFSHLSPSLGVGFFPLDYLKLRANWSHSFRPPSPRELYSANFGYNFLGYPWNKAENTDTYEIGFDVYDKFVDLSATYFYSKTSDYVYQHADPVQDVAQGRVRNTDDQRRSGVEVTFNANVAGMLGYDNFELRPYINYTHLFFLKELYRRGDPTVFGRWVNAYGNWIPKTVVAAGLRFQYPKEKLSVNFNVNYFGRVYYSAIVMPTTPYDPTVYSPGFAVANLALRKGLVDFGDKGALELRLDVNNLFDKLYWYGVGAVSRTPSGGGGGGGGAAAGYYMPGRNFYLGLAYNY